MVGYFSPVSIEWMRLLQDSNFWDFYVAENGGEAFVSNTIISAKHVWDGEKAHGKKFHLHTPDYNTSIMPPNNKLITPGMNYAERLATVVANARISMHNDALERLDLIRRRDNGENTERVGEGESLDDQESVSSYDAPSDGEEEERPNEEQILQTERIAMLIRRFRNMLGLHKCVKCMQEGLLFYLDQLALLHHQGNVTPENWVLFLKQCNSSGQMLVYVALLVHVLFLSDPISCHFALMLIGMSTVGTQGRRLFALAEMVGILQIPIVNRFHQYQPPNLP